MAATRLLMRKLRDLLRLKYEAGLGHRAIARACSIVSFRQACVKRRDEADVVDPSR